MKVELENVLPYDIERRSFEIIGEELRDRGITLDCKQEPIIKRAIHTTADFEYATNLKFSEGVVDSAVLAIRGGASIVTDTQMALSGINKRNFSKFGGNLYNFMKDEDVALMAQKNQTTRAVACMDKAALIDDQLIFAIGNAPTALVRIRELYDEGKVKPLLVIAVPVGFVNVEASKQLIMDTDMPYIVAEGRKGGSNVAAAICNALLLLAL